MKIYLCQIGGRRSRIPEVPMSQLTLGAYIEDVADVKLAGYDEYGNNLPTLETIYKEITDSPPDVVGISIPFAILSNVSIELARRIKQWNRELTVIAGGHHATFSAEALLTTGYFDAVFLGEGEVSLREYVLKKNLTKVDGVMYKRGEEFIKTGMTKLVDLNEARAPAYQLLPKGLKLLMGMESSRGCPYNCDFCEVRNFFGNGRLRKMTPAHFIENLSKVIEVTGGGNFMMTDDCFTADMKRHVRPICEAIIAERLPFSTCFQGRVDNLLKNIDVIPLLAKAGFGAALLGIEAIFDETLIAMNKGGYDREDIKKLIQVCHDNGIATFCSIVFGYPTETPDMIMKTVDFLIGMNVSTVSMTMATPIPGSSLYDRCIANNELLSYDFDRYDGMHRIWNKIPETTLEAASTARRAFFQRSDYIAKVYRNALDISRTSVTGFMPAGLLCHNITIDAQSRPRDLGEWLEVLEGYRKVIEGHMRFDGSFDDFSSRVRLEFSEYSFTLIIQNGHFVAIDVHPDSAYDVALRTSADTLIGLFVWCPIDIMSAYLKKLLISSSPSWKANRDFIRWFTEVQKVLRWARQVDMEVPMVKGEIARYLLSVSVDSPVMLGERRIFIGNNESGGFLIGIRNAEIFGIELTRAIPQNCSTVLAIAEDELQLIISGDLERLARALGAALNEKPIQKMAPITFDTFLASLPGKFLTDRAQNLDLCIQFSIKQSTSLCQWWMKIERGTLSLGNGQSARPYTAKITLEESYFNEMINGFVLPVKLYSEGKLFLEGTPQAMIQMAGCFKNLFSYDK